MYTVLESIATANPAFKVSQAKLAEFMVNVEGVPASLRNRIRQIYARSGIDYRYTCIGDYERQPKDFDFYPSNWALLPFPTTGARNQKYQSSLLDVAQNAAQQVIWQAGIATDEISHLIVVSCTGFFAPGLDIHLVKCLGLRPTTARTLIGFMGCHAAFNGLKTAHAICQTYPNAKVLLVCAELCTLHFQFGNTLENVAINSLFSDGVAAALLTSCPASEAKGKLAYVDDYCLLDDTSLDYLTWNIGDTGFLMGLSRQVPDVIAQHLPKYIAALLDRNSLTQAEIDFWAIHPGGRRIVETAQAVLSLADQEVYDSYEVLRLYGNMSSATILFILKRLLDRHHLNLIKNGTGYRSGVALAFGPGLSIEGCLFRQV